MGKVKVGVSLLFMEWSELGALPTAWEFPALPTSTSAYCHI